MSRRATCVLVTALSIVFAAMFFAATTAGATDASNVLEDIEARWPDWLPNLEQCPADVMPARGNEPNFSVERCATSPGRCLDRCRAGDASDCYATALVFQRIKDGRASEALFLRACALGYVSGCTNRAAGMDKNGKGNSCAIRTYELACDRNDPWACTMIGFHLIRAAGVNRDYDRARKALAKSCRFGEDDPARAGAKALLKEIAN